MGTIAVTGSASGIGAATRKRLEMAGETVVGVDVRDAEIIVDLSSASGRQEAIAASRKAAGGQLHGLVTSAGVGPHVEPWSTIVSLNYFGGQVLLAGLRELLAAAAPAAAVAVSSNSAVLPGTDAELISACLCGEEENARRVALTLDGHRTYASSKLALAQWVRHNAPTPEWAKAGVRLNAVAPGAVKTPLLQGGLDHPLYGDAIRNFPIPTGGFGEPSHIAAAVAFLLSPDAGFCCGTVLFADGGTDAMLRPDTF